jgi:CxxC motif-containing protein
METKQLTCIVCPLGCDISAQMDGGSIVSISGHTCKRGESYARTELSDPRRTLTTTMRVTGGALVSVKSKDTLPKGKLFDCMKVINATHVQAPIDIGDVLIKDILGLGVDIVATSCVGGV